MEVDLSESEKVRILSKVKKLFGNKPVEAYFVSEPNANVCLIVEWIDGRNSNYVLGRLEEMLKRYPVNVRVFRSVSNRLIGEMSGMFKYSFVGNLMYVLASKFYERGDCSKYANFGSKL